MLLAIETSSRQGAVALAAGDRVIGEKTFAHGLQNAAMILPLIDELCREHGLMPRQIQHVAVSIGPGSFTGLRIGVTLAKTLCFAVGAKLIAVPTMPVMAMNAPADAQYVMPILDAKRDQVFAAVYQVKRHEGTEAGGHEGRSLDELLEPQLVHLPDLLARAPRPLLVLGEGVKYHMQHLQAEGTEAPRHEGTEGPNPSIADRKSTIENVDLAPESLWYPRASTVVRLALKLMEQKAFADPFKLTPLYIRKPEAQERMEAGLLKHLQ